MNTLLKNLRTLYNAKSIQDSGKKIFLNFSLLSLNVFYILKREGYIQDLQSEKNKISVTLPKNGKIQSLKTPKLSRPIYLKFKEIENSKQFSSGLGVTLFSTSQGISTYSDVMKRKIGGIFLFQII